MSVPNIENEEPGQVAAITIVVAGGVHTGKSTIVEVIKQALIANGLTNITSQGDSEAIPAITLPVMQNTRIHLLETTVTEDVDSKRQIRDIAHDPKPSLGERMTAQGLKSFIVTYTLPYGDLGVDKTYSQFWAEDEGHAIEQYKSAVSHERDVHYSEVEEPLMVETQAAFEERNKVVLNYGRRPHV